MLHYFVLYGIVLSGVVIRCVYCIVLHCVTLCCITAAARPKELCAAIKGLSRRKQKCFVQAYRTMQLEGSVFGVCIIQLKPQLERLLNLPNDSLTKEIKLTQAPTPTSAYR